MRPLVQWLEFVRSTGLRDPPCVPCPQRKCCPRFVFIFQIFRIYSAHTMFSPGQDALEPIVGDTPLETQPRSRWGGGRGCHWPWF